MAEPWTTWTPATERRKTIPVERSDGITLNFDLRALSFKEREDRDLAIPLPLEPARGDSDSETEWNKRLAMFQELRLKAEFSRWVWMLDKCWHALDGATLAEKEAWADANLTEGMWTILVGEMVLLSGRGSLAVDRTTETPVQATPDALKALCERRMKVRLIRQGAESVELSVKIPSRAALNAIDRICAQPDAPEKVVKYGGQSKSKPNYDDPAWQAACRLKSREMNVRLLEEAVASMPGKNYEEKADWLGERPAWEVDELSLLVAAGGQYRSQAGFF